MAEGREIAANHMINNTNHFSFTYPNHPWFSSQWLFSLLAYLTHQSTGINGLIVLKIVVFLTIVYLLIATLRRHHAGYGLLTLLIALFVLAVQYRIMIRAHLSSILLFILFMFLIDRFRSGKPKALFWLPAITILWTNLHSGLIFGLILLALAALEEALLFLGKNRFNVWLLFRQRFFKQYLFAGLACFLATLINPQGLHYLVHTFSHLGVNEIIKITEYQEPWKLGWIMAGYYILATTVILLTFFRLIKTRILLPYDLITLVFLVLSIKYNRIVPYFAAVASLQITVSLSSLRKNTDPDTPIPAGAESRIALQNISLGILLILAPLFLFGNLPFLLYQ